MLLIDVLLPEYDRETGVTRCLLERIPESRLDWHPHDTSMPLGRLASHLADLPRWIDIVMTRDEYDLNTHVHEAPAMTSTDDLVARFDRNVSSARGALVDATDSNLSSPWSLRRGKDELFRLPRIGVLRYFVLNHLVHHRGQLSVYLRMQGVPIPAIYGPSADERTV
jgi:uncharacterized damage-inducible protein DinB